MFTKCKVVLILVLFLLCASNAVAAENLAVKLGYQLLSPEGSLAGTVNGVGQQLDVDDDLNLDDSEGFTGEIALHWGRSRLAFNYLDFGFSGAGTLTAAGEFNGQSFSVDDRVDTDLNINLYDFSYTFNLINLTDLPARFQLGPEVAVKVVDIDLRFDDRTQGFSETEAVTVPIPTIGARARVALADFVGLVGRISYLEIDENYFLDAEAQLEFSPVPLVGIYLGARLFEVQVEEDDIYVETEFSGPYGGLLVRF